MNAPPAKLRLSRELRLGLHDFATHPADPPAAANSFAGNPALLGLAPFVSLIATVSGDVDPSTGMLLNVKDIDSVLRSAVVPMIRRYYYADFHNPHPAAPRMPRGGADLLRDIFHVPLDSGTFYTHAFFPHCLESLTLRLSPFLALAIHAKDSAMVQLSLRFEFSAAHRLHSSALSETENRQIFGRCNNPNGHGHNYELEVTVAGPSDPATGQIISIHTLQQIVNEQVIIPFDHKHLNLDCPEFRAPEGQNPTVENIAAVFFARLGPRIPAPARLASLKLWETPKTMCEINE